jgi:hypothetical protein
LIRLMPDHIEAYGVLSRNLSLHLGRFREGVQVLHRGIHANRHHPRVHELWGAGAHLFGFRHGHRPDLPNDPAIALRYARQAALVAPAAPDQDARDPFLASTTYLVWQARFLVDLGRPAEALQAWRSAGLSFGPEHGLLGEYLARVAAGRPVPRTLFASFPVDLAPPLDQEETEMAADPSIEDQGSSEVPSAPPTSPGACVHGDACTHGSHAAGPPEERPVAPPPDCLLPVLTDPLALKFLALLLLIVCQRLAGKPRDRASASISA